MHAVYKFGIMIRPTKFHFQCPNTLLVFSWHHDWGEGGGVDREQTHTHTHTDIWSLPDTFRVVSSN